MSIGIQPAYATLTDEKNAFVKASPCPKTGKPSTTCAGHTIVYPACAPTRAHMRWSPMWDKAHWVYRGLVFCACRTYPVEILATTTRGRTVRAINCKLVWA